MSDTFETLLEAIALMHPITKSWLIHGAVVTQSLSLVEPGDLDAGQRLRLADGCHQWGELLTQAGLLWWDAEQLLRADAEEAA